LSIFFEIREGLNTTAAWEFVDAMLGIDYGWEVGQSVSGA
jgi:hypothetical protein